MQPTTSSATLGTSCGSLYTTAASHQECTTSTNYFTESTASSSAVNRSLSPQNSTITDVGNAFSQVSLCGAISDQNQKGRKFTQQRDINERNAQWYIDAIKAMQYRIRTEEIRVRQLWDEIETCQQEQKKALFEELANKGTQIGEITATLQRYNKELLGGLGEIVRCKAQLKGLEYKLNNLQIE